MVFDWLLDFWTNTEWIAMLHKKKSLVVTWQFRFYMFNKYYVSIHRSIIDKIRVIYCITLLTSINILGSTFPILGEFVCSFATLFFFQSGWRSRTTLEERNDNLLSVFLSFLHDLFQHHFSSLPHYSVLFSLSYWKSMSNMMWNLYRTLATSVRHLCSLMKDHTSFLCANQIFCKQTAIV